MPRTLSVTYRNDLALLLPLVEAAAHKKLRSLAEAVQLVREKVGATPDELDAAIEAYLALRSSAITEHAARSDGR